MAQPIKRPKRPKIFQDRYEVLDGPVTEDSVWDYRVKDESSGETLTFKKVLGVYAEVDHRRLLARIARRRALGRTFPPVLDAGREGDEVTWLVVPALPVQTLGELARRDPESALVAFARVLAGLAEAHDAGIWHGRIMPSRVRIGDRGEVLLVDLGLYLDAAEGKGPYAPAVSSFDLGWVAPEVLRGHRPGPASDVWQLGLTLHAILSGGAEVFGGQTTFAKARCVLDDPPAALFDDVPKPMRRLVEHCLDKSPRLRPRNAGELLEAFEKARAGELEGEDEDEEEETSDELAQEEPDTEEETWEPAKPRSSRPAEAYVLGFGVVMAVLAAVGWYLV